MCTRVLRRPVGSFIEWAIAMSGGAKWGIKKERF
jgi:hypothetical protein